LDETRALDHRMRSESRGVIAGSRSPRTDFGTDIAAECPVPDLLPQLRRHGALVLDRLVADARPRIDLAGRDDRTGGAGVEARRAGPARPRRRPRRRLQLHVEDELS